jgi:AraC-like DNA-binding protein
MAITTRQGRQPERSSEHPRALPVDVGLDRQRQHPIAGGVIRLGVAIGIPVVLRTLGADPEPILVGAGLDPRLFDDEDNTIPFAALGRLLALCVAHTNCPHFGLLVGERAGTSSLGIVGFLMEQSETVGDALRGLVSHLHLHDRGAAPMLAVEAGTAILSYAIYEPRVESAEQISDGAIATAANIMQALCGPDWVPAEVLLPRQPPGDLEPFRRLFRAPVRFDQEMAALVFSSDWLDHRIAGASPVLRRILEQRIEELEAVPDRDFKDSLRRVLRTRLLKNRCSADNVADLFAMHRRTLNRRLSVEGTAFRAIADEVRFEIARQLLADTSLPLSQIAAALDYSEGSAFTRAFRRWTGKTPTAWRAEHRRP